MAATEMLYGRVVERETGRPVSDLVVRCHKTDYETWLKDPGRLEISSGRTGSDGRFELEMSAGQCKTESVSSPDGQLLVVLSPNVADAETEPVQCGPREGLLFHSDLFRDSKTGSQGLLIRVPRSRLREMGLSSSWEEDAAPHLTTPPFRSVFGVAPDPVRTPQETLELAKSARKLKQRARNIASIIGRTPVKGRPGAFFVPSGADSSEVRKKVLERGIVRMERSAERVRGLRVPLLADTLTTLDAGFELNADGVLIASPDTIPHESVEKAMSEKSSKGGLEWSGDPKTALCGAGGSVDDIDTSVLGRPSSDGEGESETQDEVEAPAAPSSEVEPAETVDLAGLIEDRVRATLAEMDGVSQDGARRPTTETIAGNLQANFRPGPADVPSYHDFHKLHIAFENVWTAAVDRDLRRSIEQLYEAVVRVEENTGINPADATGEEAEGGEDTDADIEITNLQELVDSLRERVDVAEAVVAPSVVELKIFEWKPAFESVWPRVTDEERTRAEFLLWVYEHRDNLRVLALLYETGQFAHSGIDTLADIVEAFDWDAPPGEGGWHQAVTLDDLKNLDWANDRALELIAQISARPAPAQETASPRGTLGRAKGLIEAVDDAMRQPYQFDVFEPNSYNFGILTTYRQRWTPVTYQAGELVGTLPLAPGEKKTFKKNIVVKRSRARKELEKAVFTRATESQTTSRAEAEILKKASYSTNYTMNTEGSLSIELADVSVGHQFSGEMAGESQKTKKDFREAVRKASQEYRRERTLEISTEESFEATTTETGEISNPNNEITVTYLFYELQRRFQVTENLHRVTPVILWAFDVPTPDEIDEAWLLEHDWILRRVLLDDRLEKALDYISETFTGDEVGISVQRAQWEAQMRVVEEVKQNFRARASVRQKARAALSDAAEQVSSEGFGEKVYEFFMGGENDEDVIAAERDTATRLLEWADADFDAAEGRLGQSLDTLKQATDRYVSALRSQLNRRTAIDQLKLHVKQNIIYYMQAIWAHEPPDQRYFRLYDEEVRVPRPSGGNCKVDSKPEKGEPQLGEDCTLKSVQYIHVQCPPPSLDTTPRELHEIADLDRLLGFKGNYAIFPLKEPNAITNFMMQDFADLKSGLRDPDPRGLIAEYQEDVSRRETINEILATNESRRHFAGLVNHSLSESEMIVVPTGALFIEALPGAHPLLEDFKLRHRAIDVAREKSNVRQTDMETLRYAARLAAGEREDPEVEKRVLVTGASGDGEGEDIDVDVDVS